MKTFFVFLALFFARSVFAEHLVSRDIKVHDPSTIVKCNNEYWVFFTGNGIPSAHSKDLIHWENGPPVFTNLPAWIAQAVPAHRGAEAWAPDVMRFGNEYRLYYSVSIFGKNTSVIGLAANPTLDPRDPQCHWTDRGPVIGSNEHDNFNTIDPTITQDVQGRPWLVFGSYWSGVKLIQLDPATGKRVSPESTMYSLAYHGSIEASYLYHHGDFYYLFVNWGQCCQGVKSTYEIRIGRSREITGPYLDKDGQDMLHDGGSLFLGSEGRFIGPGHAGIVLNGATDWFSCHFYDGEHEGKPSLGMGRVQWGSDDWPSLASVDR